MFESPTTTEAEVLLASRGDREAFARLVAATRSLVSSIALVELRDVEAARDVAQDVYLQVWDDLHELRNPASFLPFLRQVTRLRARRVAERRAREVRGPAAEEAMAGAVDPALDPPSRLIRAERAALVREALDALPEDARETIALYYLEGHSASQVARLLGLREQAVYQRLSRARGQLRADVLARLGETIAAAAPGAAFTAGVMAALPSSASAQVATTGMAAAASSVAGKVTVGGGVVVALVVLAVFGGLSGGGRTPGQGGGGGSAIARPVAPVTRDDRAPAPEASIAPVESGLEVRVTARGAPAANAEVKLYRRMALDAATGRPAWQVTRTARTGTDGRVRLPAGSGPWLVTSRATGLAPGQVEVVHPTGIAFTRVEIELHAPSALSGRVVARPSGEGVPLATLWLERESSLGMGTSNLPVEERSGATASPRGDFTAGGLSPGRHRLVVEAPGHARTVLRQVVVPRAAPLVVELGAAGVIEGMVTLADGRPAAGAEVSFVVGPEVLTVTSGSGGGYSAEVNPGSYRVVARLGGAAGAWPNAVPLAAGATARVDVRLGAAAVIAGRVTDGGGVPISGADLVLTPAGTVGEMGRALTGSDGTFEIGPLGNGEYDLDVVADGFSPDSRSGLVVLPGQRFGIDFRLERIGVVEGVVRDTAGAPLEGARVSGGKMWGGAAGSVPAEAVTGADGRYVLPGLEVGVASIRARRPGAATGDTRTVTVRAGRRATADFILAATGILEGEVRTADGRSGEAGLRVIVVPDRPVVRLNGGARVDVAEGGGYRVELPEGDFKANAGVEGRSGPGKWVKVKVAAAESTRLDLVVEDSKDAPGTLAIEVREPGGAPATNASVTAESPGFTFGAVTDDTGRVSVKRRPGAGSVTVTARKGGRVSMPVVVEEASPEVALDLLRAASVQGRLVAPGAPPVDAFTLDVETPRASEGPSFGSNRRHFSGDRFVVSELPSGPVRLVATTPDGRVGELSLSLSPGESAERDIAVQVGGAIQVRPVGADDKPVEGAYVVLGSRMVGADGQPIDGASVILGSGVAYAAGEGVPFPGGGGSGGSVVSGAAPGTVVVDRVPPGRHSIRVGARDHTEVVKEVEVPPGGRVDLGAVRLVPVPR